jgi:microcin C transport system substrate-binding protein
MPPTICVGRFSKVVLIHYSLQETVMLGRRVLFQNAGSGLVWRCRSPRCKINNERAGGSNPEGLVMRGSLRVLIAALGCLCALLALPAAAATSPAGKSAAAPGTAVAKIPEHTTTTSAIALYGEPKYPANFNHFDYVNPDAPKGGTVHLSGIGSYDSFNPFALRGTSAISILNLSQTYDALMTQSADEPTTWYPLIAESITYPDDYAWIEYNLNPKARWHDGTPITSEDVVFTYQMMRDHSAPFYRTAFQQAAKIEAEGPHKVRITFRHAGNRRNLTLFGIMAIIPKHYWQGRDFEAPIVTPPLSSGPYEVSKYEVGRSYTLTRVKDYWAKDLPVNKGRFNYDTIVTDYYRDTVVAWEAFKAGDFDTRTETSPKDWATGYVFPAFKRGDVIKDSIKSDQGFLYEGFYYNLRRPLFQDPVLREALAYAFDFNWMNKNLFYNFFVRTRSYFGNGDLAAHGLPSSAEVQLLQPYRDQVPARVFTTEYNPPDTDGTEEGLRNNLRIASQMLTKAGYKVVDSKLISPITHQPVAFQILMSDPGFQLVSSHWADNLKLLGIDASTRTLNLPEYIKATQAFDYDVLVGLAGVAASPGTELKSSWGSQAADTPGSLNYVGVKSPVVDYLLDKLVTAQTLDDMLTSLHALDRVLCWNFYSVPNYGGGGAIKIAYWNRFGRPKIEQSFGIGWNDTWWIDPAKDAALKLSRSETN